jgi:hypothetical protein
MLYHQGRRSKAALSYQTLFPELSLTPRRQIEHNRRLDLVIQVRLPTEPPNPHHRCWFHLSLAKVPMDDERHQVTLPAYLTNQLPHLCSQARHSRYPRCPQACKRPPQRSQHRLQSRVAVQRHLLCHCPPKKLYQHHDSLAIHLPDVRDHLLWALNLRTAVPLLLT